MNWTWYFHFIDTKTFRKIPSRNITQFTEFKGKSYVYNLGIIVKKKRSISFSFKSTHILFSIIFVSGWTFHGDVLWKNWVPEEDLSKKNKQKITGLECSDQKWRMFLWRHKPRLVSRDAIFYSLIPSLLDEWNLEMNRHIKSKVTGPSMVFQRYTCCIYVYGLLAWFELGLWVVDHLRSLHKKRCRTFMPCMFSLPISLLSVKQFAYNVDFLKKTTDFLLTATEYTIFMISDFKR